jgi:hypothetical protein
VEHSPSGATSKEANTKKSNREVLNFNLTEERAQNEITQAN